MRSSVNIELHVSLYSAVQSPPPHDHRADLWCVSVDGIEQGRGWIHRSWGIRGTGTFMKNPTWNELAWRIFTEGKKP